MIQTLKSNRGWVDVICGPMFAGKSTELLRRIEIIKITKEKFQVFSHAIDTRYAKSKIANHNGWEYESIAVTSSLEIEKHLKKDTDIVLIDEVQFFDIGLVKVVEQLANNGVKVICAGLSLDFTSKPFQVTSQLLLRAEYSTRLNAICNICGKNAYRTQRLVNGEPASAAGEQIVVGNNKEKQTVSYQSRCRNCFEVIDFDWEENLK